MKKILGLILVTALLCSNALAISEEQELEFYRTRYGKIFENFIPACVRAGYGLNSEWHLRCVEKMLEVELREDTEGDGHAY